MKKIFTKNINKNTLLLKAKHNLVVQLAYLKKTIAPFKHILNLLMKDIIALSQILVLTVWSILTLLFNIRFIYIPILMAIYFISVSLFLYAHHILIYIFNLLFISIDLIYIEWINDLLNNINNNLEIILQDNSQKVVHILTSIGMKPNNKKSPIENLKYHLNCWFEKISSNMLIIVSIYVVIWILCVSITLSNIADNSLMSSRENIELITAGWWLIFTCKPDILDDVSEKTTDSDATLRVKDKNPQVEETVNDNNSQIQEDERINTWNGNHIDEFEGMTNDELKEVYNDMMKKYDEREKTYNKLTSNERRVKFNGEDIKTKEEKELFSRLNRQLTSIVEDESENSYHKGQVIEGSTWCSDGGSFSSTSTGISVFFIFIKDKITIYNLKVKIQMFKLWLKPIFILIKNTIKQKLIKIIKLFVVATIINFIKTNVGLTEICIILPSFIFTLLDLPFFEKFMTSIPNSTFKENNICKSANFNLFSKNNGENGDKHFSFKKFGYWFNKKILRKKNKYVNLLEGDDTQYNPYNFFSPLTRDNLAKFNRVNSITTSVNSSTLVDTISSNSDNDSFHTCEQGSPSSSNRSFYSCEPVYPDGGPKKSELPTWNIGPWLDESTILPNRWSTTPSEAWEFGRFRFRVKMVVNKTIKKFKKIID